MMKSHSNLGVFAMESSVHVEPGGGNVHLTDGYGNSWCLTQDELVTLVMYSDYRATTSEINMDSYYAEQQA